MSKVVLIVEDDVRNMKLFRDLLQHHGFAILEATNGKEGVKLALEKSPDLILMDIQMPVMDGLEATRIIKADSRTKGIPIVALTSYAMKGDRERVLKVGCDEYISKPVDIRELTKMVDHFCQAVPVRPS